MPPPQTHCHAARTRAWAGLVSLAAMSGLLGGCTSAGNGTSPIAHTPPRATCPHVPPPRLDAKPLPPVSAFPQVLQPGHWEWDTSGYVWQPAHWQARLSKHPPHWLDGFWEANGGACVWHNGQYVYGGAGH